jgi:hypothetical protein
MSSPQHEQVTMWQLPALAAGVCRATRPAMHLISRRDLSSGVQIRQVIEKGAANWRLLRRAADPCIGQLLRSRQS